MDVTKPYNFIGFGAFSLGQCTSTAFAQGDLRDRHLARNEPKCLRTL